MSKWLLIVDVARCCNCQNCVIATKDEYVGNNFPGYAAAQPQSGHEWLTIDRHVRGSGSMVDVTYVPRMCNHCDAAPCTSAGAGAVRKRPDGIVIIDPVKAKGNRKLVSSCPYGAITWNEASQLPQQWIFDAHLLDQGWREPRCAQVCPTGALKTLKASDEEMAKIVDEQGLTVLRDELRGTQPRVLYRNLQRVKHHFVGGNVVRNAGDGCLDNVEGATVRLGLPEGTSRTTQTDRFGDFKFDDLLGAGERYTVRIDHAAQGIASITLTLTESVYLGSIELR